MLSVIRVVLSVGPSRCNLTLRLPRPPTPVPAEKRPRDIDDFGQADDEVDDDDDSSTDKLVIDTDAMDT